MSIYQLNHLIISCVKILANNFNLIFSNGKSLLSANKRLKLDKYLKTELPPMVSFLFKKPIQLLMIKLRGKMIKN